MFYTTRNERDAAIVDYFNDCLKKGLTKTQATEKTRVEFRFLTSVPIYSARRRLAQTIAKEETEYGK